MVKKTFLLGEPPAAKSRPSVVPDADSETGMATFTRGNFALGDAVLRPYLGWGDPNPSEVIAVYVDDFGIPLGPIRRRLPIICTSDDEDEMLYNGDSNEDVAHLYTEEKGTEMATATATNSIVGRLARLIQGQNAGCVIRVVFDNNVTNEGLSARGKSYEYFYANTAKVGDHAVVLVGENLQIVRIVGVLKASERATKWAITTFNMNQALKDQMERRQRSEEALAKLQDIDDRLSVAALKKQVEESNDDILKGIWAEFEDMVSDKSSD